MLANLHVHAVDIRSLFAIDFHRDKILGHELRDLSVGKGLALHHVTPMTGGVADGEKNRLVLTLGFSKRRLAPRIPIDRVGSVLKQIGALLKHQAIVVLTTIGRQLGQRRFGW